jgi:anti-anti-sigma factor
MTAEIDKCFRVERHGTTAVIVALPVVDKLIAHEIQYAAPEVMALLKANPPTALVIDLSQVTFFRSAFLSFLLRCQMLRVKQGIGTMVLAGLSPQGREVLSLCAFDKIWNFYGSASEAIQALTGS